MFAEIEQDKSVRVYQGQACISIANPTSGVAIDAVTFGIDASSFG